jgi:hypothetical protein
MYAPSAALFSIQLSPFKTTVFERLRNGMEFKVSDGRLAMKTELVTVGWMEYTVRDSGVGPATVGWLEVNSQRPLEGIGYKVSDRGGMLYTVTDSGIA